MMIAALNARLVNPVKRGSVVLLACLVFCSQVPSDNLSPLTEALAASEKAVAAPRQNHLVNQALAALSSNTKTVKQGWGKWEKNVPKDILEVGVPVPFPADI